VSAKLKPVFQWSGLAIVFAVLVIAFGYLDTELAEERRWFGCALILAGMAMVVSAALRLASDWPRLKPLHNTDLAFVQVGAGLAILTIAALLGGRTDAVFAPLVNPTPQIVSPPTVEGASAP
jgi:hypothetical protein